MKKRTPKPKIYVARKTAGNLNDKIDRNLLHQLLWNTRDRMGFNTFKSGELAEELGITVYTMSHLFKEMVEKGFLKKVGGKYLVIDPKIAAWNSGGDKPQQESMF